MAKDALGTLEDKVQQAAVKLAELKSQNLALADKVAGLEERLAASSEGGSEGGEDLWASEREEIRERVEALVATLERLLEE